MAWELFKEPGFLKRIWRHLFPRNVIQRRCPHCQQPLITEYEKYPQDPFAFGPCPACGKSFPLFENVPREEAFLRSVRNNNPIPEENLVVLASDKGLNLSTIPKGILFLMALWSGGARQAFQCLKQVLAKAKLDDLRVYVLDVDGMSLEFCQRELSKFQLGGWGETFWIRDGKIKRSLLKYTSDHANVVEEYTRDLLGSV
jgi:hypothetical protein